jgi:hypothetical protein
VRHVDALGIRASLRRLGSLEAKQQHHAGAPSIAVEAALDAATEFEPRVRAARAAHHVPNAISQRAAPAGRPAKLTHRQALLCGPGHRRKFGAIYFGP